MKLCLDAITKCKKEWIEKGYNLPEFDVNQVRINTFNNPKWVHFGAGNIFRAFPATVLQKLINSGIEDTGLTVVEGFDEEIIDKIYTPFDNLSLLVTLKSNGHIEKTVIASIAEALTMNKGRDSDTERLQSIMKSDSLQMLSFTITEKGYSLTDATGNFTAQILDDFEIGPEKANSYMGKVTALCYDRYKSGEKPLALVSMDNFSHNGDKLKNAVITFSEKWNERGMVEDGFLSYLNDDRKITFPWSMIDKITPRPDETVAKMLKSDGFEDYKVIITSKNTYIAPFVNAEEPQYLVIEDEFPCGHPNLAEAGIIFTNKDTVDKVEKMKVCTCLNPLHTALAIFGCLLSYKKISDEMDDPLLTKLVFDMGYNEGLPVVVNPVIINPEEFLKEVLEVRIPNPFMPDTPQRIATDTSQKISIRFGETIKAYVRSKDKDVSELKLIPLVLAGWCRYLMGIDDTGNKFEVSPDPLYNDLKQYICEIKLGDDRKFSHDLQPILSNQKIFGIDLYDIGMADTICKYFAEMTVGPNAVRKTLEKYVV